MSKQPKAIPLDKIIQSLSGLSEENLIQLIEAANAEKEKREADLQTKLTKLNGGKAHSN